MEQLIKNFEFQHYLYPFLFVTAVGVVRYFLENDTRSLLLGLASLQLGFVYYVVDRRGGRFVSQKAKSEYQGVKYRIERKKEELTLTKMKLLSMMF